MARYRLKPNERNVIQVKKGGLWVIKRRCATHGQAAAVLRRLLKKERLEEEVEDAE